MRSSLVNMAATGLALAQSALAGISVNNGCDTTVYFYNSYNGGCDAGSSDECFADPFTVEPGGSQSVDWDDSGAGTSLKISKSDTFDDGVLQFEYARPDDGIYWDLSDLDGTPFRDDGVTVTPSGDGAGDGNCVALSCSAGTVCEGAFQEPDDPDVHFCPSSVDDFDISLCE